MPPVIRDLGMPSSAAPFILLSLFAGGPHHMAAYARGGRIQVDDRMALEFSAPRAAYAPSQDDNAAEIRALAAAAAFPAPVAEALASADTAAWTARGAVALRAGAHTMATASYRRAVVLDGGNAEALRGLSRAAARLQQTEDVRQWFEVLARQQPSNASVRDELSYLAAARGSIEEAVTYARDAMRLVPDDPRFAEQLASVLADAGDVDRLTPVADDLLRRFPDRPDARYYQAVTLLLRGQAAGAAAAAKQLLAAAPAHAKAQNLLGVACAATRDLACARNALTTSIGIDPRDPAPYVNLGLLLLEAGDRPAAAGRFREALALDPGSVAARQGLATASNRSDAS
jgi:Flp pilus assembly protein TadD